MIREYSGRKGITVMLNGVKHLRHLTLYKMSDQVWHDGYAKMPSGEAGQDVILLRSELGDRFEDQDYYLQCKCTLPYLAQILLDNFQVHCL